MKVWKSLQSPFALILQGFAIGALLFFTVHPLAAVSQQADPPPAATESVLSGLEA
jgi:hypothetical protein